MFEQSKYTSVLFILSIVGIIAIPPSALFISEYGMFAQAIILCPAASILLFIALAIIAYAMLALTIEMVFTAEEGGNEKDMKKEKWNVTHTVIAMEIAMIIFLAVWFTTGSGVNVISNIVESFLFIK